MISERKIKANRENARASTGPRTAAGKVRAARNAQRHGLTLSVLADRERTAELNVSAQEIAGKDANSELIELASRIAAAQIDLVRVRQARQNLLSSALNDLDYESPSETDILIAEHQNSVKYATILADMARRLIAMDRYERRALSRRKFAIREFDAARA